MNCPILQPIKYLLLFFYRASYYYLFIFMILYFIVNIPLGSIIPMLYDARIAENYRMRRNIAVHVSVRSNKHVVANRNIAYDCTVDTYPHAIADYGSAFTATAVLLSDRNPFMNIAVPSDDSCRIYRYSVWMSDIQSRTNRCFGA